MKEEVGASPELDESQGEDFQNDSRRELVS